MRKVKFESIRNGTLQVYPNGGAIEDFHNVEVIGNTVYAEYFGNDVSIEDDDRVVAEIRIENRVNPIDVIVALPIGTEKKLEAIKSSDSGLDGDMAARALMIITTGYPVDVNSETFDILMNWMLAHDGLDVEQGHIDEIRTM